MGREIDKEMLKCWKEISESLKKLVREMKIHNVNYKPQDAEAVVETFQGPTGEPEMVIIKKK